MIKKLLLFTASLFTVLNTLAQAPIMNNIQGSSYSCSQPGAAFNYTANATNASTYFWSVVPSAGVVIGAPNSMVTSISFPNTNLMYTISCFATNNNGTSNTVNKFVQVFETPTVTFSGLTTVCQGSPTYIMASPTLLSGSSSLTYNWTPNAGFSASSSLNTFITASSTTSYSLSMMLGPCSNTAVLTLSVNPAPTVMASSNYTMLCAGNSAVLTISGTGTVYQINGVNAPLVSNIAPATTTMYNITTTDALGCSGSYAFQQQVSPCTSLENLKAPRAMSVYPNPCDGNFTIVSPANEFAFISNEMGQVIRRVNLIKDELTTIEGLAPGMYYLTTSTCKMKIVVYH